ncbi:MAG: class I tRNA ligase family protein [Armatimonadetes bacterium]|nr:class I tRNA ligase family protein [Armatimonadota bacterium]
MDTFVDSSWYYLRYASQPADAAFRRDELDRWMPVTQYVGGIEHATMHLIYARFFTKVLYDLGLVGCEEPFERLFTQGMVTREVWWCPAEMRWYRRTELTDGDPPVSPQGNPCERIVKKMSKSLPNTVAPEGICEEYGADTLRCYILFVGPPEAEAEWQDDGVSGVHRFVTRAWRCFVPHAESWRADWRAGLGELDDAQRAVRRKLHETVAKVGGDLERFSLNTAIPALMELVNVVLPFVEARSSGPSAADRAVYSEAAELFALILAPFAPHLADEIWSATGHAGSTFEAAWPEADAAAMRREQITVVVQVNGKVRDRIEVDADADQAAIEALVMGSEKVQRRVIYVPGRLVNIVV